MHFETTGKGKVQSVQCCLLFDAKDGAIRHMHHVVTLDGAEETPEADVEKRAFRLAADLGLEVNGLRPLHLDPEVVKPGTKYKVDPESRKLLPVEAAKS